MLHTVVLMVCNVCMCLSLVLILGVRDGRWWMVGERGERVGMHYDDDYYEANDSTDIQNFGELTKLRRYIIMIRIIRKKGPE